MENQPAKSSPTPISQDDPSPSLERARGCSAWGTQSTRQGKGQLSAPRPAPASPSPSWSLRSGLHPSSPAAGRSPTPGPRSKDRDANLQNFLNEALALCLLPEEPAGRHPHGHASGRPLGDAPGCPLGDARTATHSSPPQQVTARTLRSRTTGVNPACHDWMTVTSRGHVRSPRGFQKSHLPLTPNFFVGVVQVLAVTNSWSIPKVIPGLLAQ